MKHPRFLDFFCGAGGFSEGFRQQGFRCLKGYDNWAPAVRSHNLNHDLNDSVACILDFEGRDLASASRIEADDSGWVPDSEVIVGSPPCVSFSMSNKAGKADKSLGIRLIESFLRVVAIKKHKPNSVLKAWLMENVPNSRNFVKPEYTFQDLGLREWAKSNGLKPSDVALRVQGNGDVLVAWHYGSPQKRERFVCGEWIETGEFPAPRVTHEHPTTLRDIRRMMPSPTLGNRTRRLFRDPNYPSIRLKPGDLTDHFYDTGVYSVEWKNALYAKVNHPFMGRMSFPENEDKPSRTIMATRSASTREALIYRSEYNREGDGKFRLPTIREAATLMGFPWHYQFEGSEGTKWKQIGNAVCPHMSAALAKEIRSLMGLRAKGKLSFAGLKNKKPAVNLNTFTERGFPKPPRKKVGGKFRRHPFKDGNMTIALTNYLPGFDGAEDGEPENEWYAVAFLGSGKSYKVQVLGEDNLSSARKLLKARLGYEWTDFEKGLKQKFLRRVPSGRKMREILVDGDSKSSALHPADLVDSLAEFLGIFDLKQAMVFDHGGGVLHKRDIPLRQVLAVYALASCVKKTSPVGWGKVRSGRTHQALKGLVQKDLSYSEVE